MILQNNSQCTRFTEIWLKYLSQTIKNIFIIYSNRPGLNPIESKNKQMGPEPLSLLYFLSFDH